MSGTDFIFALSDFCFGENEVESIYQKNIWDSEQYLNLGGFLQQKYIQEFRKSHFDNLPIDPIEQIYGGNDDDINTINDDEIDNFLRKSGNSTIEDMLDDSLNISINGSYHIVKLFFEHGKQTVDINTKKTTLVCDIIQTKLKYILEKAADKFLESHSKLQFQVKISVKAKNIDNGSTENIYFTIPSSKNGNTFRTIHLQGSIEDIKASIRNCLPNYSSDKRNTNMFQSFLSLYDSDSKFNSSNWVYISFDFLKL